MHEATLFKAPPSFDDIAANGAVPGRDAAVVVLRRSTNGNSSSERPATDSDEIESRAQHARAANGLGDLDTAPATGPHPANYEWQQSFVRRAFRLGDVMVAAIRAGKAIARRAYARYRRRREASAFYDALRQLDDRTLRDIGLDRSEIGSVVAEATGIAEHTRLPIVLARSDSQW